MKKQRLTRKEVKQRNQEMYEIYMNNENLGNKDIAKIFNLSLESVDIILSKIKKENNTKRTIKPRDNKMGLTEEEIVNTFKEFKTLNKTSEKLNISAGYIAKVLRKNNLEKLIIKIRPKLSKLEIKERNQNIWKYFIENKPKNYMAIEKNFNLGCKQIKIIMRNLKKENNYPLGVIGTKSKRIRKEKKIHPTRFTNFYEKVAYEQGVDVKSLFAY